jgi:hypothetical protein
MWVHIHRLFFWNYETKVALYFPQLYHLVLADALRFEEH